MLSIIMLSIVAPTNEHTIKINFHQKLELTSVNYEQFATHALGQDCICLICGLYYKNTMIVNDATNWSITLESSITLLESSISCQLCSYRTGITHDDCHLQMSYFNSTGHWIRHQQKYFFSAFFATL